MSHYCCKSCGQRYERCHCPPASASTVMSVVGDKPNFRSSGEAEPTKIVEREPQHLTENELVKHHTLGDLRMHLDFLIMEYGEDTVLDIEAGFHTTRVTLIPDPKHRAE